MVEKVMQFDFPSLPKAKAKEIIRIFLMTIIRKWI